MVTVRCLGWEDEALQLTANQVAQVLDAFFDEGAISPAARPHMALAHSQRPLSGDGDRLYPVTKVTRAQFCLVVYRAERPRPGGDHLPDPEDARRTPPAGQLIGRVRGL